MAADDRGSPGAWHESQGPSSGPTPTRRSRRCPDAVDTAVPLPEDRPTADRCKHSQADGSGRTRMTKRAKHRGIDRRTLLKHSVAGGAALATGTVFAPAVHAQA